MYVIDIAEILAITFFLGVPSLALATHLVIRPLIRDIMGIKSGKADREQLVGRLQRLEDMVGDLDHQVHRLVEAERFRRELEAGPRKRDALDV